MEGIIVIQPIRRIAPQWHGDFSLYVGPVVQKEAALQSVAKNFEVKP